MPRQPLPSRFYEAAGYCAEESVGFLMKRVLWSIAQHVDTRLEEQGLTMAQCIPLFKLRSGSVTTAAEVARELQTDPGATTRLLDRLEAKGLCRRQRSTDDRRVVHLELTPEGEKVADVVPVELAAVLNEHLAGFSKAEWTQLKDMLRRMLANGQSGPTGDAAPERKEAAR